MVKKVSVTVTIERELEAVLDSIYGKPRTGLSEDVAYAIRKIKKRKTRLPDVDLPKGDTASITFRLTPEERDLLTRYSGDQSRSGYLRSLLLWMLTLKVVKDRQLTRDNITGTSTQLADYDTMKTTFDKADVGTLSNSTIATAFMGISTKLSALAEHWGVDRDRALILAIGQAYDQIQDGSDPL